MKLPLAWTVGALIASVTIEAPGFTHVVMPGESLSNIAMRVYGNSKFEGILAGANSLDVQGGSGVIPGMRIEIPAPSYHRAVVGDSWSKLALDHLGAPDRGELLARLNGSNAWTAPAEGAELRLPFVMTVIAASGDTTLELAKRYLGDEKRAWEIHSFNGIKKPALTRGQVVLLPLIDLALTDAGKEEAANAARTEKTEAKGAALEIQRKTNTELPELLSLVRGGRYLEVVAQGNRLLGTPELTRVQSATIERALVEAYVALDAKTLASSACGAWKTHDAAARVLDVALVSPKIRAACK